MDAYDLSAAKVFLVSDGIFSALIIYLWPVYNLGKLCGAKLDPCFIMPLLFKFIRTGQNKN